MSSTPLVDQDTEPHDAPEALVGRSLDGRFHLREVLSATGMGMIYRARQHDTDRMLAVKVLRPTQSNNPDSVRRFSREIELLSRLNHPHIVTLLDAGRDAGGLSFMALEFIDGVTLRRALKHWDLSLCELTRVMRQVAAALAEAHDAEIVHRDLKLDNIMVSRKAGGDIHATILDFGVARPLSSEYLELTGEGSVPGTPDIVAPELVDGAPPSPRSDLYSLGIVFYTVLSGSPPFSGDHELDVMQQHLRRPVPPLEPDTSGSVPVELTELTGSLLAKSPENRPESAVEVRTALQAIERQLWDIPAARDPYDPQMEVPEADASASSDVSPDEAPPVPPPEERGPVEKLIRTIFGEQPVVAPTTVLIYLSGILLILVVVLVALLIS
jgi:serine/threonine-protein kinase